jgi:hypothetical protein
VCWQSTTAGGRLEDESQCVAFPYRFALYGGDNVNFLCLLLGISGNSEHLAADRVRNSKLPTLLDRWGTERSS